MPTFYGPGKRTKRRGGKVYTNATFVVRGRIDGQEYEITTDALRKSDASDEWDEFKREVRQRQLAPTRATATFSHACDLYEDARDLSKNEKRYIKRLRSEIGHRLLCELRPGDIIEAAHALYPGTKPQTKNRQAIRPACAAIHVAAENELCDWIRTPTLKELEPEVEIRRPADMSRLCNRLRREDPELYAVVFTIIIQGWRISETLAVKRDYWEPKHRRVRRLVGKSRKWKWTALDEDVNELWKTLPKERERLFRWQDRHNFYRDLRPHLEKLGFRWTPHMSRRGFATSLIEAGSDLKSIMAAGGWEDLKSVARYADANLDQARRTIAKIRGTVRGKDAKSKGKQRAS